MNTLVSYFEVSGDLADPIEVGGQTTYTINVLNQGAVPATKVVVTALVPEQMEMTGAKGPMSFRQEGRSVVVEPMSMRRHVRVVCPTNLAVAAQFAESGLQPNGKVKQVAVANGMLDLQGAHGILLGSRFASRCSGDRAKRSRKRRSHCPTA
jgi:uncharacterized repeat protein (TIGR01451 family)